MLPHVDDWARTVEAIPAFAAMLHDIGNVDLEASLTADVDQLGLQFWPG